MSNEEMNDSDDGIKLIIYNLMHPSYLHHLSRDNPLSDQFLLATNSEGNVFPSTKPAVPIYPVILIIRGQGHPTELFDDPTFTQEGPKELLG